MVQNWIPLSVKISSWVTLMPRRKGGGEGERGGMPRMPKNMLGAMDGCYKARVLKLQLNDVSILFSNMPLPM